MPVSDLDGGKLRSFVRVLFLIAGSSWVLPATTQAGQPPYRPEELEATLFLTWEGNPQTSMVVEWLQAEPEAQRIEIQSSVGNDAWKVCETSSRPFGESSDSGLWVGCCRLRGLTPDTRYRLRFDGRLEYSFQTPPMLIETPVSIAFGGDAGPNPGTVRTCRLAASQDPMFAVLGGDLAYANGRAPERWVEFLGVWHREMRRSNGDLIPLVVSIGNHEVDKHRGQGRDAAPYFYSLFALFAEHGYASLDFGWLTLLLLDSGHTEPVAGAQSEWLERELQTYENRAHLIAVYHVPGFPSFRRYEDGTAPLIREHWSPLFERYGVDWVFENNDHTFKRTHPLRGSHPAADGVVYFGDGSWGVLPRSALPETAEPYLANTATGNVFTHVTLTATDRFATSYESSTREVVDGWPLPTAHLIEVPELTFVGESVAIRARLDFPERRFESHGQLLVRGPEGESWVAGDFRLDPSKSTQITAAFTPPRPGRYEIELAGMCLRDNASDHRFRSGPVGGFEVVATDPRPGRPLPSDWVSGVRYEIYEGRWRWLPDLDRELPERVGIAGGIRLDQIPGLPNRYAAVRLQGALHLPEPGFYEFRVTSDDGAQLWIGERLLTRSDGRVQEARVHTGRVHLGRGWHRYRIEHFQARGVATLEVELGREGSLRPFADWELKTAPLRTFQLEAFVNREIGGGLLKLGFARADSDRVYLTRERADHLGALLVGSETDGIDQLELGTELGPDQYLVRLSSLREGWRWWEFVARPDPSQFARRTVSGIPSEGGRVQLAGSDLVVGECLPFHYKLDRRGADLRFAVFKVEGDARRILQHTRVPDSDEGYFVWRSLHLEPGIYELGLIEPTDLQPGLSPVSGLAGSTFRVRAESARELPQDRGQLRVLTWNLGHARGPGGPERIARILYESQADLILLQECSSLRFRELLAAVRENAHYLYATGSELATIISRYPIVEEYSVPGVEAQTAAGIICKRPDGSRLRVVNLHLEAQPYGPYELRDGTEGPALVELEEKTRGEQLSHILRTLPPGAALDAIPTILGGDLNTPSHLDWTSDNRRQNYGVVVPWPVTMRLGRYGFRDDFRSLHRDPTTVRGFTWSPGQPSGVWPVGDVADRIDYIFSRWTPGHKLEPRSAVVLESDPWPSDHRAVVITYE